MDYVSWNVLVSACLQVKKGGPTRTSDFRAIGLSFIRWDEPSVDVRPWVYKPHGCSIAGESFKYEILTVREVAP